MTQKFLTVDDDDDDAVVNETTTVMVDGEVLDALTTIAYQVQLEENQTSISIRTPNIAAEVRD